MPIAEKARNTKTTATTHRSVLAATTNPTVVKTSPGRITAGFVVNESAAAVWLKFHNKATAPTPGTDAVVRTVKVPIGGATLGGISELDGWPFPAGIAYSTTAGLADNDATAIGAGVIVHLDFA
jgi:hypothetical protein